MIGNDYIALKFEPFNGLQRAVASFSNNQPTIFCELIQKELLSILLASSYSGFLDFPKHWNDSKAFSAWDYLFVYVNTLAMFFSVIGLVFFASCTFLPLCALDIACPSPQELHGLQVFAKTFTYFLYISFCLWMSLSCHVLAYIFAGMNTVRGGAFMHIAVLLPSFGGLFIFMGALYMSMRNSFALILGIRKIPSLWEAVRNRGLFGYLLHRFVEWIGQDNTPSTDPNHSAAATNAQNRNYDSQ